MAGWLGCGGSGRGLACALDEGLVRGVTSLLLVPLRSCVGGGESAVGAAGSFETDDRSAALITDEGLMGGGSFLSSESELSDDDGAGEIFFDDALGPPGVVRLFFSFFSFSGFDFFSFSFFSFFCFLSFLEEWSELP